MKIIRVTCVAAATLLAGCGGGGKDDALRKEVEALRQQVATTSTTAPPTTVTTEASTTTTQPPVTTTKPTPTTQRITATTQRATTTTALPTTTTTAKKPQGMVDWERPTWYGQWQTGTPPYCAPTKIHVTNRSDTAVLDVTFGGLKPQYSVKDPDGTTRSVEGAYLPSVKKPAGIAPYGETDVNVDWCGIGGQNTPPGTYAWTLREVGSHMYWTWMGEESK